MIKWHKQKTEIPNKSKLWQKDPSDIDMSSVYGDHGVSEDSVFDDAMEES